MSDPLRIGGWLLLYDYCMTNSCGLSSSPDLLHWTVDEAVNFPADARHGSVARLRASEAEHLRAAFPAAAEPDARVNDGHATFPRVERNQP